MKKHNIEKLGITIKEVSKQLDEVKKTLEYNFYAITSGLIMDFDGKDGTSDIYVDSRNSYSGEVMECNPYRIEDGYILVRNDVDEAKVISFNELASEDDKLTLLIEIYSRLVGKDKSSWRYKEQV